MSNETPAAATLSVTAPDESWKDGWLAINKHQRGRFLWSRRRPIYCLPGPAIDRLWWAQGRHVATPLSTELEDERAFTALCQAHRAVGCWRGGPICYPLLTPRPLPLGL